MVYNQYDRLVCIKVKPLYTVIAFLKPSKDATNKLRPNSRCVSLMERSSAATLALGLSEISVSEISGEPVGISEAG